MKRVLLICLALVLALVGGSTVGAQEGFYVIPTMKKNYAPVPKTGQTIPSNTRDDGWLKKGVAWPTPRFTDNNNGTVTDNLTGLIWTKNANMFGTLKWEVGMTPTACAACNTLNSPEHGLTDGSVEGNWRLPNRKELESLVSCGFYGPALPNTLGTGTWTEGNPFQGVQSSNYWSSSTYKQNPGYAWSVDFYDGFAGYSNKDYNLYVWCVRGGK